MSKILEALGQVLKAVERWPSTIPVLQTLTIPRNHHGVMGLELTSTKFWEKSTPGAVAHPLRTQRQDNAFNHIHSWTHFGIDVLIPLTLLKTIILFTNQKAWDLWNSKWLAGLHAFRSISQAALGNQIAAQVLKDFGPCVSQDNGEIELSTALCSLKIKTPFQENQAKVTTQALCPAQCIPENFLMIQSYWGRAKDWFLKTEPIIEALRSCSVHGNRQLGNHVSSLVSWWLNNHGVPSVPLICFVAGNQPLCVSPSPSTWQKLFTSSSK